MFGSLRAVVNRVGVSEFIVTLRERDLFNVALRVLNWSRDNLLLLSDLFHTGCSGDLLRLECEFLLSECSDFLLKFGELLVGL